MKTFIVDSGFRFDKQLLQNALAAAGNACEPVVFTQESAEGFLGNLGAYIRASGALDFHTPPGFHWTDRRAHRWRGKTFVVKKEINL